MGTDLTVMKTEKTAMKITQLPKDLPLAMTSTVIMVMVFIRRANAPSAFASVSVRHTMKSAVHQDSYSTLQKINAIILVMSMGAKPK